MKTHGEVLLSLGFHDYKDYGRFLAKQIDRDRFVQIRLEGSSMNKYWDGIRVEVFSKTHGKIGSEEFTFSHHMEKGRSDNPYAKETVLHIWHNPDGGLGWYIVKPTKPGAMMVIAEEWIDEWRT